MRVDPEPDEADRPGGDPRGDRDDPFDGVPSDRGGVHNGRDHRPTRREDQMFE
jgi:hypothetical protein